MKVDRILVIVFAEDLWISVQSRSGSWSLMDSLPGQFLFLLVI